MDNKFSSELIKVFELSINNRRHIGKDLNKFLNIVQENNEVSVNEKFSICVSLVKKCIDLENHDEDYVKNRNYYIEALKKFWDIEKTYTEFKAIGSKKYIVKTTDGKVICRCAGLPESVRENQTFEDFYIGATFKGKKVKTKLKGGYALIEGEYTLHDNIFRG